MTDEMTYSLPTVLNVSSDRIDALRVAEYLDLPATGIAEILESPVHEVLARPDSPALQSPLKKVVFVLGGLLALFGQDKTQLLIWLNAPHPQLDHDTPLDLMRGTELDVIVEMVDDALSGAPA